MSTPRSEELFQRAKKLVPGGVNSPVRYYPPYPKFFSTGKGAIITDVEGEDYTDYCMAFGPLILGHAHPDITDAVAARLREGTMLGTPTGDEVELAELVTDMVPSVEMLRLVNSGTEATMHALRLARAYTGRDDVVKFDGCYHGAYDYMLVKAGSGVTTYRASSSLGVPQSAIDHTISVPFNDLEAVEKAFQERGDIAAIIAEPVLGNSGLILPKDSFLQGLRRITEEHGALLIFDEIITGFRLSLGGAQKLYAVEPDLTTLGKILGGGFPLAAYGGKREIMEMISPEGKVYQASTFAGNSLSVKAGLTMLNILNQESPRIYDSLERRTRRLASGLRDVIQDRRTEAHVSQLASMWQIFFTDKPVNDSKSAKTSDTDRFRRWFASLLDAGVYVPPSQFETCFLSTAHDKITVERTLEAFDKTLRKVD